MEEEVIAIVNLRLPAGLKRRIKAAAAKNGRSLNSEIVFHLRQVYGECAECRECAA